MLAWLEDGSPAPETAQEKGQRIRAAREAAGMSVDEVRRIMESEFNRSNPAQLSSEDCDRLIAMIEALDTPQSA